MRFLASVVAWCIVLRNELERRRQLAEIRRRRAAAVKTLRREYLDALKRNFN